jgi:hypothetical protein
MRMRETKGRVYEALLLALKTEIKIFLYTVRKANEVGSIWDGVCRGELVHRSRAQPLCVTSASQLATNQSGDSYQPRLQLGVTGA